MEIVDRVMSYMKVTIYYDFFYEEDKCKLTGYCNADFVGTRLLVDLPQDHIPLASD